MTNHLAHIDQYLNIDTGKTYTVLTLYNAGMFKRVQIRLTAKQVKELRDIGVETKKSQL